MKDRERAKLAALLGHSPGEQERAGAGLRLFLGGHWKTFEAKVRDMHDPDGGLSGRVMVLEDLTELIAAQQRAAWRDAARRVAHQIKNPLTPIRLSAERILRRFRDRDPEADQAIEQGVRLITKEVDSLKSMVDEFSQFARMRPPQPHDADMNELVHETVRLYAGIKAGVEVECNVGSESLRALVDREQIKQVLVNLLDNAVEAVEPPGRVAITVARCNGALRIDVADTGKGISQEDRDKLFLPHFSTKGRGTGLGLSIVHRIVGEHHGTVHVLENKPQGTIFRIEIPQT